ncbi:expressed unknown protein [Seminavis robusta]|uniref:Uncharacterized protein n=1 Tax=Seminavis robusta TaxID=568900 RepID=A0A9N8E2E3_9STRA|nr:expressed unknown protein [Seminavis robusta]|eukprot:Sro437_g142760.1 n/a (596) ;mRNA; f:9412-11199
MNPRLHWNGPEPPATAAAAPWFHDSLGLYRSLLAVPGCDSVELVRIHCFFRNQMLLGIQVVYASSSTTGVPVVKETASSRLVFPALSSSEVQRQTFELDTDDALEHVDSVCLPLLGGGGTRKLVQAVSFQSQQGILHTLGAAHKHGTTSKTTSQELPHHGPGEDPSLAHSPCTSGKRRRRRVIGLVATRDPEFGLVDQIGYYYLQEEEEHHLITEPTSRQSGQSGKDLIFHEPCSREHYMRPKHSTHKKNISLTTSQNPAAIVSRRIAKSSTKRQPALDSQFSDLAFYQRLCNHPRIAHVKLYKICCYYNDNAILRLYGIYQCTIHNDGESTTATIEVMPTDHAEWKHSMMQQVGSACRVFTITLQSGEFLSRLYCVTTNTKPFSHHGGGSIQTVSLITNRRSIDLQARLMKETTRADDVGAPRRVVALAGSIVHGRLHRIGYVTEPTNWHVLKPWILLWHAAAGNATKTCTIEARVARMAQAVPISSNNEPPRNATCNDRRRQWTTISPSWISSRYRVHHRHQPAQQYNKLLSFRWKLGRALLLMGRHHHHQGSSRSSFTSTREFQVLQQLLQHTNNDTFRHILSFLAPSIVHC